MLRKLFRDFAGATRDDPVFGRLVYKRGQSSGGWHGAGTFAATGDQVELQVEADETGPGEAQRELYRKIESRWPELRAAVGAALTGFHRDVLDEERVDVWSTYRLAGVFVMQITCMWSSSRAGNRPAR